MGSNRVVLPERKFSGQEDIREFLRDFDIYVAVNEWSNEKAGQFLAVFLKDDAKAFYHQQAEVVKKSYSELCKALKDRYEGGLALLKYKKDFNSRARKDGETLHSYLSDLRLAYERAYSAPVVEAIESTASAAEKKKHAEQEGALAFYNQRKDEDILCQFINGLRKDLREVLIRQDDLLQTSVEVIVKRVSTLEEERDGIQKIRSVQYPEEPPSNSAGPGSELGEIDRLVKQRVQEKLDELAKANQTPVAAVKKGGKRFGKQRAGPKPTDVCRGCNGLGHWARSCPSLNEQKAGLSPQHQS